MPVKVGIDLGTTFSAVATVDPITKTPKIIKNCEGERITPSVIQFCNGKTFLGSGAESAFNDGEKGCVTTFKRSMGSNVAYCVIEGKEYTAEDLSAILIKKLKEDAETEIGDIISEAVIAVPAYFYSPEREATIRAATKAGLKVKKIIDEPNAAAIAYGLNNWRENANILVYDLGGGTFDVTLTHMEKDGELNSVVTRGDHLLGGRDWDNRIESLLVQKFSNEIGSVIEGENLIVIRGLTEGVKKQLSSVESTDVKATFSGFGSATIKISRQEFDDNTSDLLERTGVICRAVIEEANLKKTDVSDVLLVGGSTRMPQVSKYLYSLLGKKPISRVNPDEAVALGAAIQVEKERAEYAQLAVTEKNGKKVTSRKHSELGLGTIVKPAKRLGDLGLILLRETTAHAMGVVAINDEKNCYYNEIIIPANHPRPVRAAKRFRYYTSPDSDNKLEIYLLQGDSQNPLDCLIPYKYVVSGIQHVNKGEKIGTVIRVQYGYDENGIIHVQARQGNSNIDLPLCKDDTPTDVAKFGKSVVIDITTSELALGVMLGKGSTHNVVHKYKSITFSNVKWEKYDNIAQHPSGAEFNEPSVHIVANGEKIEFHGYNVSQMDEGVSYTIDSSDDFEIECDINTSTIQPHPGGRVKISLGIISANLNENGGDIFLDGESVATVGSRFRLKMALNEGGHYEVHIDRKVAGNKYEPTLGGIDVVFGFMHGEHCCQKLSHAYISNINMKQRINQGGDAGSSKTDIWDD